MINPDKIRKSINEKKIKILSNNMISKHTHIVFLLNGRDIVYIGKTKETVEKYVYDKQKKITSTHYYSELINDEDIDNTIAEYILTIKPLHNKQVPKNTKYISNNQAVKLYFISKAEFRKHWKEHGNIKFGDAFYLEKKIFDDIFALPNPYHLNMPRINALINDLHDIKLTPINVFEDKYEYDRQETIDGKIIETNKITHGVDIEKNYNNLNIRLKHAYKVTNLLSSTTFEAYSEYKNETKISKVEDKKKTWDKTPDLLERERIEESYFKKLQKKKYPEK